MQCFKEFVNLINGQTQIIKGITGPSKSRCLMLVQLLDFSGNKSKAIIQENIHT